MPKDNNLYNKIVLQNPFFSLFFFNLFVILIVGYSTNVFGQIAIPLSELNSKLPKNINGTFSDIAVLGDQLYVGDEEGLWVLSKDGTLASEVEGVIGRVNKLEAINDQIFAGTRI